MRNLLLLRCSSQFRNILFSNPTTSICKFPSLCVGGCQAACKTDSLDQTLKLSGLVQQSCKLSWQLEQETTDNVVFVLAGKDLGGMWNLMFDKLTERTVDLTEHMTAKFVDVVVLAVGPHGVTDKAAVSIEHTDCGEKNEDETTIEAESEDVEKMRTDGVRNTIQFFESKSFFLCSFLILCIFCLVILCISNIKTSPYTYLRHIDMDGCLASKEDFEIDDFKFNEQIYIFIQ